ncbi:SDR family oxidoreductase [Streptomyces sp. JW3]|uniref:SDR family oxidoreductase n=1 Tax=Streptomyces sp. JW3 TaxID=3456955 RepID=UPI003FA44DB8
MSRTYVVTGSASGIGRATKEVLEADGHRVIGIDLHDAEIVLDLADGRQRATIADRVTELSGGSLDAVIAVAGASAPTTVGAQVNYYGARDCLVGLRPLLLGSSAPRAAIVSSISAIHPNHPGLTEALLDGAEDQAMSIAADLVEQGAGGYIYTSSKRAISEWVRRTAVTKEWAGAGIALNVVAPGTIVTPMTAPHLATAEGRQMMQKTVPMPLNGPAQPEVVGRLLAWLTGEENSHIAGQTIFLDGGAEAALRGPHVFEGLSLADIS